MVFKKFGLSVFHSIMGEELFGDMEYNSSDNINNMEIRNKNTFSCNCEGSFAV